MPVCCRRSEGQREHKEHFRRGACRPATPGLFTITEEEEGNKGGRGACRKKRGEARREGRGFSRKEEPLVLKIDERQRLARERREEREKQNAAKEWAIQEREERARQHYEKHLEDRRRRLEEQRMKEDKRRVAVEEKRRQKLEEEMARHEAVLRRTVERSQRVKHVPNRWSWGGALPGNSPNSPRDAERRSVSTMNLSKHPADAVITKRLSYSSATLLPSPDRGMRRMQLTPWQSTVGSRLLQPTHSYLARSRSAVSLSGDAAMPVCPRSVSCHPMGGAMSFKSIQSQTLTPCRGHEPRLQLTPCRGHEPRPPKDTTNRRRTTGNLPDKHKDYVRKSWTNLSLPLATPPLTTPPLTKPTAKRSQSPGTNRSRAAAPSPGRMRPPTPRQLRTPDDVGNIRPSRTVPESLSLIGLQTGGGPEGDHGSVTPSPSQPRPQTLGQTKASPNTETKDTLISPYERVGSPPALRPTVGTSDPEEATRILAEKRRQAREQKEREDQERRAQEEQERHSREELAQRKEEEKQRREQESLREEEKRRREEEEREQEEREEAQRQQKQREEEECRQKEELERQRVEREKRFQKEEAERMERKKRLEEIMKRTRRSDQSEKLQKNNPQKTGDQSVSLPVLGSGAEHGDRNGHRTSNPDPPTSLLSPADERENGSFEEVLILPATRPLPPGSEQERSRREPLIAFQENGMVKALPGGGDDSLVHAADVV